MHNIHTANVLLTVLAIYGGSALLFHIAFALKLRLSSAYKLDHACRQQAGRQAAYALASIFLLIGLLFALGQLFGYGLNDEPKTTATDAHAASQAFQAMAAGFGIYLLIVLVTLGYAREQRRSVSARQ